MSASGEYKVKIHKIDDRRAYELLASIKELFGPDGKISIHPVRSFEYSTNVYGVENILTGSYAISEMRLNCKFIDINQTILVYFNRCSEGDGNTASPHFDSVRVVFGGDPSQWRDYSETIRAVMSLISATDTPVTSVNTGDGPDILRELILSNNATHRAMMESLNKSVDEMILKRHQLERDATTAEEARRISHEDALKILEKERLSLQLQSHMSERRTIAKTIGVMASDLSRRSFKPFSARIGGIYIITVALCVTVGAGLLSFVGFQVHEVRMDQYEKVEVLLTKVPIPDKSELITAFEKTFEPTNWYLILKSIMTGIVAIGSFSYAASWIKRYYDEDVALAREMQLLNADVARATWVIEAIHEVKHEAKGELPKEWIDAVTRNLFTNTNQRSSMDDGAMALRALMGFTANASFGPDGPKFEINRKGAKGLANADED